MMMTKCFLGIDTSNYTTSIAVVDQKRNLLFDARKLLTIQSGQRGLRQSDAFFQHIHNMPILFQKLSNTLKNYNIQGISVSSRPRPVEKSYMPVFRAGQSFGKSMAYLFNCTYQEYSHQENHIESAKWSLHAPIATEAFIGVHISGGTTEILYVKNNEEASYKIDIIGGTTDISAGQFIDRMGVKLGFNFPAGKDMDRLAMDQTVRHTLKLPVSVKDTYISFSGPETMAYKLLQQNENKTIAAQVVLKCIAQSLEKAIINSCRKMGLNQILIMGGVAASQYLRCYLSEHLAKRNYMVHFGEGQYCTDNAVGVALLASKNKDTERSLTE
jgi:N6-L-threonylcarbamoyladenine synthase